MGPLRVAVFGAGAWGTALALVAARAGHDVDLVGRSLDRAREADRSRRSPALPEAELPAGVRTSADPALVADADLVLVCVPAQATRSALPGLAPFLARGVPLVACAKGIDRQTGQLVGEVIGGLVPNSPVAVLSGPGFAVDVARGLPTAVTVAAEDEVLAGWVATALAGPGFRPYASTDPVGVQLGGALKNVLAIASGIVAGRRLGASAEAAVVTRGFVELRRLAAAWGARPETAMGLSGLGDLILTCRSLQSRNFSLGHAIGAGEALGDGKLAEGAATAAIAVERAAAFGIEVPIMAAVAAILAGEIDVDDAIDRLLARPLKREDG